MEKASSRLKVVALLMAFMFAALTTRLWFLQVLAVAQNRRAALDNSVQVAETDALRGTIKDAKGRDARREPDEPRGPRPQGRARPER